MTRWIVRWKPATGPVPKGPGIGSFAHRRDAEIAVIKQVRAAADALEFGTGKAGTWTPDGRLYCDDLDDRYLGRYIVERVAPDSKEK
jgi:hypothetical protein